MQVRSTVGGVQELGQLPPQWRGCGPSGLFSEQIISIGQALCCCAFAFSHVILRLCVFVLPGIIACVSGLRGACYATFVCVNASACLGLWGCGLVSSPSVVPVRCLRAVNTVESSRESKCMRRSLRCSCLPCFRCPAALLRAAASRPRWRLPFGRRAPAYWSSCFISPVRPRSRVPQASSGKARRASHAPVWRTPATAACAATLLPTYKLRAPLPAWRPPPSPPPVLRHRHPRRLLLLHHRCG